MQSYDKISFKNDFVREEFITTLKREDIPDEMIIHKSDEGVSDTVNFGVNENTPKNEGVNGGVNENTPKSGGVKEDIEGVKTKNEGVNFGENENTPKNEGVNGGVNGNTPKNGGVKRENGGVSKIQQKILDLIEENQHISVIDIAKKIEKPRRTVENNMKQLKDKGLIERFGSDKTGGYKIVKNLQITRKED